MRTVTRASRLNWSQALALLTSRRWLLGLLALFAGGSLRALALSLAPLVVVQPIGVLAIGLTALLATLSGRVRRSRATGIGVTITTAGIAGFVRLAAGDSATGPPSAGTAIYWIAAVAA